MGQGQAGGGRFPGGGISADMAAVKGTHSPQVSASLPHCPSGSPFSENPAILITSLQFYGWPLSLFVAAFLARPGAPLGQVCVRWGHNTQCLTWSSATGY